MSDTTTTETSEAAAVPDKPPGTVNVTIDGTTVNVPEGIPVLEAAKLAGIEMSSFCYHPGLSIVAVCRQCLVSIEGNGKLQPSCQAVVQDGMVVHTTDDRSKTARQQMLEFTLLNHPIDCPICDKAGECTLQKLYFDHDNHDSRVDVPKVHKPKVVDLGPHIVLDAERCILCTRCIRVCDEVAGVHQLEMRERGDHTVLGCAPGAVLDNPYSINTVDVCPVGALTSKDYRFTLRAWELMATNSVCNGCATGCNIEIHHKDRRTWRLIPRENADVNKHWMCDDGRFTYHDLRNNRTAGPVVDGLPSNWPRSLMTAAERLKTALDDDRGAVGVVFSAQHTNEDNWVLAKFIKDQLKIDRIYLAGKAPAPDKADDILRDADQNPNRKGVVAILGHEPAGVDKLEADLESGSLKGLLVLGHEVPLSDTGVERAGDLDALIVIADREVGIAAKAHVLFAAAAWAEVDGTITNRQGKVQRMYAAYEPPGNAMPAWKIVSQLARASTDLPGDSMVYDSARKLFKEMASDVKAFEGAEWGKNLLPVQLRFAGSRG